MHCPNPDTPKYLHSCIQMIEAIALYYHFYKSTTGKIISHNHRLNHHTVYGYTGVEGLECQVVIQMLRSITYDNTGLGRAGVLLVDLAQKINQLLLGNLAS